MSMDRTLKVHGGLSKARSVLKRAERIKRLIDEEKFDLDNGCPLGLPKTKVRHSKAGTKSRKTEETPAATAETPEDQAAAGKAGA